MPQEFSSGQENTEPRTETLVQPLDAARCNRALLGTRFAGKVRHFATIDSTSTALLAQAATGGDGTVFVADEQTAGRGRGDHRWHAAPGSSLLLSALVRTPLPPAQALWITLATGLAAQAAIAEATGIAADIRWPNDLLLPLPQGTRKCGGILVESPLAGTAGTPVDRPVVIGIGINVNQPEFPPELSGLAASLPQAAGGAVQDRERVLLALLRALDLELLRLESSADDLLERFARASSWVEGKAVRVGEETGAYSGTTAGLNAGGFLQVLDAEGKLRTVLSGGVREA